MPTDVQMDVGPTVVHPLPKTYMEATEKYSGQVKIVELPDGALTLSNYQGGIPFPNPSRTAHGLENSRQRLVSLPATPDRRYVRQRMLRSTAPAP